MLESKYIINKEKRTIVCLLTTTGEFKEKLEKYGFHDYSVDWYNDVAIYTGVAKCAPEDEWDENYGKQLAEYRAHRARQAQVNEKLKKYMKRMARCIDNLYDYGLIKDPHKPEKQ